MRVLFNIFLYILQNFMNVWNMEFVLFCLIFSLIYFVYSLINL